MKNLVLLANFVISGTFLLQTLDNCSFSFKSLINKQYKKSFALLVLLKHKASSNILKLLVQLWGPSASWDSWLNIIHSWWFANFSLVCFLCTVGFWFFFSFPSSALLFHKGLSLGEYFKFLPNECEDAKNNSGGFALTSGYLSFFKNASICLLTIPLPILTGSMLLMCLRKGSSCSFYTFFSSLNYLWDCLIFFFWFWLAIVRTSFGQLLEDASDFFLCVI